ncbi:SDR family NAD(P)-dependent oxidoreductase [Paracoccus sp. (in: a-proteobacteria)]|uniref:SDR family NAD(P)-dependent oxidoreductase n=1 Tax=Paracoccus sp. TaxID=267 RepID=UPI0026DF79A3|nr:SDR family NAD(P)-dependent oxidoreductase [Paracoccus sp. (in: a-proteobacteria)]MDO5368944.1 SDR family NAD(P)-dependent oxidoreductase [Paracoccus sp. (in: a-proteobacteria)]
MTPFPDFSLEGRTALVTGAGRGLGRAIAEVFAQAGAEVILCARTGEEIEAVAAGLRDAGHRAEARPCDVTDLAAFRAVVDGLDRLDVFVNNAGTNRPRRMTEVTEEDFDLIVGLNLRAAFFAMQAVTRRMMDLGRGGSVINMSSMLGHIGAEDRSVYCASKWGIEGLTKAASIELAPHRIRVNSICPTFIETPLTKPYFENPAFLDHALRMIKLGRLGQVEDITGAALYLASGASALMTGSSIVLDGGWTAE